MGASANLTLQEAIDQYLAIKSERLTTSSQRAYREVLREFSEWFPSRVLADFEPAEGTVAVRQFLDDRWGSRAAQTYNKSLSVVQDFFVWHTRQGHLTADPAGVIERRKRSAVRRASFTDEQRLAVLRANPDVRDSVPLRLLLDYGLRKGALQTLRFGDFDRRRRQVVFQTRGKTQTLAIPDDAFWAELERLRTKVSAEDGHFLLPAQVMRRHRSPQARGLNELQLDLETSLSRALDLAAELESAEAALAVEKLAEALEFLRYASERARRQVRYFPDRPRGEHGTHDWWYRCLSRGGVVESGVTHGQGMQKARHTAGRRVLDRTGSLKAVQTQLGLGSVRTAQATYANENADDVDATMRNVLRQLSGGTETDTEDT